MAPASFNRLAGQFNPAPPPIITNQNQAMKITLHTAAVDGGAFNCRPAMTHELEPKKVLTNDLVLPWESHRRPGMKLWIVGHTFGPIAALWATHEQAAMDLLCDANLSDAFLEEDQEQDDKDGKLARLGNAGELHNLDDCWILPVSFNEQRDVRLLCMLAQARGADVENLDEI